MDWQPIATADKYGPPVWLHVPALVDPDFCPTGSVEGHWQDDEGWVAPVWDACHDTWVSRVVEPTHWMPLPATPSDPPTDPDACRQRGHGRVVCADCGSAYVGVETVRAKGDDDGR